MTTLETEIYQNSNVINRTEDRPALENETVFQLLLSELECCFAEFREKAAAYREADYVTIARSALLNEWLIRSQAKGKKVRSLNNVQEQIKGSGTIGTIEGLTKEGYLQIRTESGEILTHVSGDILEIREEP